MTHPSRFALLVAVLATVLAGCGIPDNSTVVPVGPGPARDQSSGEDPALTKPSRSDTIDKATFVNNYLAAAAGDYDSATDAVKHFMSPDFAATFKPTNTDIKVIRPKGPPLVNPDQPRVTVDADLVGTLNSLGVLTPAPSAEETKYEFLVNSVPGQSGLFVTGVKQNMLLLSTNALSSFYIKRAIYFWNTDHTRLVPDLRYIPQSVPSEQQPTEVLAWLTSGPAPWLKDVAEPLPPDTRPIGNVPAISNGTLQISLSAQVLPDDLTPAERQDTLTRLQEQLRWSLRGNPAAALELNIEHQPTQIFKDNDYLAANAAYKPSNRLQRFVVYDGQVRRLSRSYAAADPIPVVQPAANRNVRMAAFGASATRGYAALVVTDAQGRQTLRVGSAPTGEVTALKGQRLANPIGRPEWAVSPPVGKADGTVGLVPAGGRLYSFTSDGSSASVIAWPGGPGGITSVAVAPDARRIALIARGRLYLATISNDDGVQLSVPTPIQTLMTNLTAVDWSDEGTLVVSGTKTESGRSAIMDVSIDGAAQTDRLADLGEATVSYLVAEPASPGGNDEAEVPVAYVSGSAAFDETKAERIDVKDLAQPVANPRATTPPPTAPSFLD